MIFLLWYLIAGCVITIVVTATGIVEIKYINWYYNLLVVIGVIVIAPLSILAGFFMSPKQ